VKDDRIYLQHVQDALIDISRYCGSDRDAFFSDRMRQDATLRKLEVKIVWAVVQKELPKLSVAIAALLKDS